jgi:glycosyltransferase involved in cell wall biosynthesis
LGDAAPRLQFGSCFFAPTGYGSAARAYLHAMYSAGVELSLDNLSIHKKLFVPDQLAQSLLGREIDPQLYLWQTEPNSLTHESEPLPRTIVLSTWEADALPENYRAALNRAREVWVPSSFNAEVFRSQLEVPVFQIPHPLAVRSTAAESVEELSRGLHLKPADFVVYANGTWQERKNLDGTIEAFLRAFPEELDAILVLKTRFGFIDERTAAVQIAKAIDRAGGSRCHNIQSRIRICGNIWPEGKMTALLKRADCYLSLHRGEGWCYPLFDAAASGIPVVATGYSGPMDYLDERYHHLVRYAMTHPVEKHLTGILIFDDQMRWAEPDVVHAAELLRLVYEHRASAREQAQAGATLLSAKYSLRRIGEMARQRLTELIAALQV